MANGPRRQLGFDYIVQSIKKRFSDLNPDTVDYVVRKVIEDLAPNKDRNRIQREAVRRLKGVRDPE